MINISKEITLLNKEKILSALYQLKSEVSKQDLAELLGIDNRNITRYFKGYVEAGLIKKWFVPTGKTRMVILEITPDGIKEAKKLPKQVDISKVAEKNHLAEPTEPKKEIPKTPKEALGLSKKEIKHFETTAIPSITPPTILSEIKEKKKLKFELMTYCSKLPIRQVDYKIFGFTSSAEMRAKIMMLISEL